MSQIVDLIKEQRDFEKIDTDERIKFNFKLSYDLSNLKVTDIIKNFIPRKVINALQIKK